MDAERIGDGTRGSTRPICSRCRRSSARSSWRSRDTAVRGLDNVAVLDVGCGTGAWLREFIKLGARPERLCGIDLVAERIAEARQLCPAGVTLQCRNAASLDFQSGTFDLVWQSMLFTSVLDMQMRRSIAAEMLRVTRPDGLILWYDYHVNNPRNPDVRAVSNREIRSLFPGCDIELRRLTLAPPIARAIAPRSRAMWRLMNAVPWSADPLSRRHSPVSRFMNEPSASLPFVSVLLPVRNEGTFIERSLGAVLAQDYPDDLMEVIVADGDSQDGTASSVASFGRAGRIFA